MIEISNINFAYGEKPVLKNVSFKVDNSESLVIMGPSGSGKSTILRLILGLECPSSGKIEIDNLKFGIYHGTDSKKKEKMINSNKFDVFICGHTHRRIPENRDIVKNEKTIVLNPGNAHSSAKMNYTNPPYFREPSIMIFSTDSKNVEIFNL